MSVEPRVCPGCDRPLPNKIHHDDRCRQAALRRRRRETATEERDVFTSRFGLAPAQEATLRAALDEPRLVALVAREAGSHWRAAAFLLERQHPERWAARPGPETAEPRPNLDGPFAEVDELARRRRERGE